MTWQLPWEATISDSAKRALFRISSPLLLTFLLLLIPSSAAVASPEAVAQAKQEAEQLRAQIDGLNNDVEMSIERYNDAGYQLQKTDKAVAQNQVRLERSQKDLDVASKRLNERVRGIYRNGRSSYLEALFSSRSFSELVNRLDLMGKIGTQDSKVLEQVSSYRAQVAAQKKQLAKDRQRQQQLLAQAASAKSQVLHKLDQRKDALRGKERQVAEFERQERERQARLVEQARRAVAAARAQARAARAVAARNAAVQAGRSSAARNSAAPAGRSSRAAYSDPPPSRSVAPSRTGNAVVDIAMQYLGVPYQWGGASPSGFDCSGFVMYVYGKVGIGLPHSAAAQYNSGTHVSRSQLAPGDLVFFGSPIHHVGIYVGGGNMIESPYTGSSVRIRGIDRSDYTGATRIR